MLVFAGDGVSPPALAYCLEGLREELDSALDVREVTAAELTGVAWEEETGAHCGATQRFTSSSHTLLLAQRCLSSRAARTSPTALLWTGTAQRAFGAS